MLTWQHHATWTATALICAVMCSKSADTVKASTHAPAPTLRAKPTNY